MRFRTEAIIALLLSSGCAAAQGGGGRRYDRANVVDVKLQSLDVVVVVAPVTTAGPQLNVAGFSPPTRAEVLLPASEDAATRNELVASLRASLAGRGFKANFIHAGASEAAVAPALPIDTSTVSVSPGGPNLTFTSSVAVAVATPPRTPSKNDDVVLKAGTTLGDVLANSTADGVLVVRVVPIDAFYVIEAGADNNVLNPATGTLEVVAADRPVPRSGRLMFGQAFLFDRSSGLRLWTRNLPDYPDGGRLTPNAPFLEYGYLTPEGKPELPLTARAEAAASKFVRAMFSDFVVPSAGNAAGRARLDAIDPEAEAAEQAFLDEGWIGLGIDLGWTAETSGASFTIGDDQDTIPDIDPLGTGAVTPAGVLRATPRLNVLSPGGFSFQVAVPFGIGPGSFSRTYHFDNESDQATDRGAKVSIAGPTTVGLEVSGGYLLPLGAQLKLVPSAGVFGEAWFLSTSAVVDDQVHLRLGLIGRFDAIYRASPTSSMFFRGGTNVRLGLDTAGPALLGGGLNVGVGVFL